MNVVVMVLVLIITSVAGTLIGSVVSLWLYMDLLANSETFVRWIKRVGEKYAANITIVLEEDNE